jgi:hypothetical protein
MAGDTLTPLLVIHRKTIDEEVWAEGWRDGEDVMLRSNDTSYVAQAIFDEYIEKIFVPYIETVRRKIHMRKQHAVLLCDNCSSHMSENLLILLGKHWIRLVTLPPHTSHMLR